MVRSSYLHRLALGRSPFEAPASLTPSAPGHERLEQSANAEDGRSQSYNARGHPENAASRALARQTRRAQNDVLSTVGVCVYVDENGKVVANSGDDDNAKAAQLRAEIRVIEENENGLLLEIADAFAGYAASIFVINVQKRLQTFIFYAGIPLASITKVELARFGRLNYMFAGGAAAMLFMALDGSSRAFIELLRDSLVESYVDDEPESKRRTWAKRGISALEATLKVAARSLLLPLHFYGTLQHLDLLPAWPLVPNPFRASYFLPLFSAVPSLFNQSQPNVTQIALGVLLSPAVTFLLAEYVYDILDDSLTRYVRAAIARPDSPDSLSFKLKTEDGTTTSASPVSEFPTLQGSVREEIGKDISNAIESFYVARAKLRQIVRGLFRHKRPAVEFPDRVEEIQLSPRQSSSTDDAYQLSRLNIVPPASRSGARVSLPYVTHDADTVPPPESPMTDSTASEEAESLAIQPSNVQIRTRSGSTSTLHMDVEINAPVEGAIPLTSSFSSSPHAMEIEQASNHTVANPARTHRVTSLSLAPASILGSRVKGALVTMLGLPFESLYLRSVAHGCVRSSPSPSLSAWLGSQIYPIPGLATARFGLLGAPFTAEYYGKIIICIGIEALVHLELWHVTAAVARWIGRRWYSWGDL